MPLPQTKTELLVKFDRAYDKLVGEIESVPENLGRVLLPNEKFSACDLVAYQIGWGRLLLGWDICERKGKTPQMPCAGYKWNQLGELASFFYAEHRAFSLRQLLNQFKKVASDLRKYILTLSEEELFLLRQRQWAGEKWPIVKWLQVNTIAPYSSAIVKLRRLKRSKREESGIYSLPPQKNRAKR